MDDPQVVRPTRVARLSQRTRDRANLPFALLAGSLVLSGGATVLILSHHRLLAGVAALVAAAGLIAGTVTAGQDGSLRLAFGERLVDRAFDGCILAPLAWVNRAQHHTVAIVALAGLGLAFVASYERARGQSLGYRGSEAIEYLAVRAAILVLALLTGWILAGLWAFAIVSGAAAAVRAWNVVRQERRATVRGSSVVASPGAPTSPGTP
jgi:hypothetical protein